MRHIDGETLQVELVFMRIEAVLKLNANFRKVIFFCYIGTYSALERRFPSLFVVDRVRRNPFLTN